MGKGDRNSRPFYIENDSWEEKRPNQVDRLGFEATDHRQTNMYFETELRCMVQERQKHKFTHHDLAVFSRDQASL